MSEKLNKKELDEVSGGISAYYTYSLYWTCAEDNIYDKYEVSGAFLNWLLASNALSDRQNAIKNEHSGKTVTFKDAKVNERGVASTGH